MIVWLDAQIPPTLAGWLNEHFDIEVHALRDLGLRDATDQVIFECAAKIDAVLVSKDADFVELVTRLGPPPKLLWVTCGNVTNARLRAVFSSVFEAACEALQQGAAVVEIADRDDV